MNNLQENTKVVRYLKAISPQGWAALWCLGSVLLPLSRLQSSGWRWWEWSQLMFCISCAVRWDDLHTHVWLDSIGYHKSEIRLQHCKKEKKNPTPHIDELDDNEVGPNPQSEIGPVLRTSACIASLAAMWEYRPAPLHRC